MHFCHPMPRADVSGDSEEKAMDEPVRWVSKAEAAEELEISLSTLDRKIRKGEVEVAREGRRVYVRMHGSEYLSDEELLRRAIAREDELERTVRELERSASELERERDEARESASASRRPYEELEEAYQKERAEQRRDEGTGHRSPRDRHRAVRAAGRQRSRVVVCAEVGGLARYVVHDHGHVRGYGL